MSANYWKASAHQHCELCGKETIKGEEYVTRYEGSDGKAIYRYVLACPQWTPFFGRRHFHEEFEGEDMHTSYGWAGYGV